MRPVRAVVLAAVLPTAALAQIFVVDASNGPGANFTSLPTAAASVPDGAVLLVRPGSYAGFSISQKGLVVLADPGVDVTGTIEVTNTAAHQTFVLRSVSWSVPPPFTPCVRLDGCGGPVVLERLTNTPWPASFPTQPWPLEALNCAQLVVRQSSLLGAVRFDGVVGAIEQCTLTGIGASGFWLPGGTTPGFTARACTLQVAGSSVRGGDGYGSGPAASLAASVGMLLVLNSSVRLLASTVAGGTDGAGQRAAIAGLGSSARVDTVSLLQGGVQSFGITAHFLPMPRLTAYGAPRGGVVSATVATQNGDLVVLAVGLPGSPLALPGFLDAFWLDPAVHVFHAIGVQQQGVPVGGSITVPNAPGFAGLRLVWHGVCFGPVTGQQNTNPGVSLIH